MKKNFIKFWSVPAMIIITFSLFILILAYLDIIHIDSYYNFFIFISFFSLLLISNKLDLWKNLNNNPRTFSNEHLTRLSKAENFTIEFYYSKWNAIITVILMGICLFLLFTQDMNTEIEIVGIEILIMYFIYLELKKILTFRPIIRISNNLIWIYEIGYISKDEINKIELNDRISVHFPFITRKFIDIHLKTSKYKESDYSVLLNEIRNKNYLIEILNPQKIN